MEWQDIRSHKGQVLVVVALALVALVGITALAVDGGSLYAERRKMQNAADAGALAGARVMCFEQGATNTQITSEARQYAVTLNGADQASVSIDKTELTVSVAVTKTANTFFAGAIGIRTAVIVADATAKCNQAVTSGNIWPLAIKNDAYNAVPCDEAFYAFVSKKDDEEDPTIDCEECDCTELLPPHGTVYPLGSGDRGWLRLFDPPDPYPDPCGNHNCGANEMRCWLENGHPGPVSVGDCLSGKPGVVSSAESTVNGEAGNIYNLVLFDRLCTSGDPETLGTCPGTPYHVAGFGCVEIVGWVKGQTFPYTHKNSSYGACDKTTKADVVIVRKRCGEICETSSGTGEGADPESQDVRSVTLID